MSYPPSVLFAPVKLLDMEIFHAFSPHTDLFILFVLHTLIAD